MRNYFCCIQPGFINCWSYFQVDVSKNKTGQQSEKKREIDCVLNTGGLRFKSDLEFYRTKKTHHIWFPLAVLQEEVREDFG